MIPLRPEPPAAVARPLSAVIDHALERGAPPPPWLVVEDDEGDWFPLLAAAPPAERARVVAAVVTDVALVQTLRLGVGGAMPLPPSTPSAVDAFAAAAARRLPPTGYEPAALEACLTAGSTVLAVTVAQRGFWRVQLGDCRIASLLAALAERLGCLPTLLSWPAIVIAGHEPEEVRRAWAEVAQAPPAPSDGIVAVQLSPAARAGGLAAAATTALAAAEQRAVRPASSASLPVCELPGGNLVGRWSPPGPAEAVTGRWLARPTVPSEVGFVWRLAERGAEDRTAVDVVTPEEVVPAAPAVARMAGWAAGELRPGAPSGLLAQRLAAAAERAGTVLWVPNVDLAALELVLRLPGRVWVDGPAVPEHPAATAGG